MSTHTQTNKQTNKQPGGGLSQKCQAKRNMKLSEEGLTQRELSNGVIIERKREQRGAKKLRMIIKKGESPFKNLIARGPGRKFMWTRTMVDGLLWPLREKR
jgi:hypothetical protein